MDVMARSLRRSQHHHRRKEHKASSEAGYKVSNNITVFPVPTRQASIARNSRWTPWVLDAKGLFYWSALRRADGSLEYAYCDAKAEPARKQPVNDRITVIPASSASSPEVQTSGIARAVAQSQQTQRPMSSSGLTTSSVLEAAKADTVARIAASSYLSLWYQDLDREGPSVGERRKLDMKIHRWLDVQA